MLMQGVRLDPVGFVLAELLGRSRVDEERAMPHVFGHGLAVPASAAGSVGLGGDETERQTMTLVAQIGASYSISQMAIGLIIIIGVLAIVWVIIKQSGVPIPQWIWTILGILLLVVVGIFAIRFLMSL